MLIILKILDSPWNYLFSRYWDMTIPQDIPYTLAAEKYKGGEFVGSAEATLQVKESEKVYATVKTDNVPKIQLNGVDISDGATMVSGIYEVGEQNSQLSSPSPSPCHSKSLSPTKSQNKHFKVSCELLSYNVPKKHCTYFKLYFWLPESNNCPKTSTSKVLVSC